MDSLFSATGHLPLLAQLAIGLAAGAALGFVHFLTLGWNASFYLQNRHGTALLIQVARFVVLFAVLFGLAKAGALALLSALVAILIARGLVLKLQGRSV